MEMLPAPAPADNPEEERKVKDRVKDYYASASDNSDLTGTVNKLYEKVVSAFRDKSNQNKDIERYWDIYNCKLNDNQQYHGDNQIYVPICRDAVEAMVRRTSNTLFPESGHYVDVIAESGDMPFAKMALLDHYVDVSGLPLTAKSLIRQGYVEGQFSVYLDWKTFRENETRRIPLRTVVDGVEVLGPEGEYDIEDDTLTIGRPDAVVLAAGDLAVHPPTANSIDEAIEMGGFVAIALRVTDGWIDTMERNKVISRSKGDELKRRLKDSQQNTGSQDQQPNPAKSATESAGVKYSAGNTFALVYQVWTKLELDGDEKELSVIHYGGADLVLSVKRTPYWRDHVPVLSEPDIKLEGSFWGRSRLDPVEQMQYQANDLKNIGQDSAQYSLLPIVLADPNSAPQYSSMSINMAALWKVDPNAVRFEHFDNTAPIAEELIAGLKSQIYESLGLSDAMIPLQKGKMTQAMVAQNQQVALANISDEVFRIERGVFEPLIERWAEYDEQYRDKNLMIRVYGELGMAARMLNIEPYQFNARYIFKWRGTSAFTSAQKIQQKIAMMNVLRGIPPQMMGGKKLNFAPAVEEITEETFGARVARKILEDPAEQFSVDPKLENEMLQAQLPVEIHPTDDDQKHIMAHFPILKVQPDNTWARMHITLHQAQLKAKAMAAQQEQMKGLQGAPGAQGQPGAPGTPRPGAMPAPPKRGQQNPPGTIHPDNMQDPGAMPRNM